MASSALSRIETKRDKKKLLANPVMHYNENLSSQIDLVAPYVNIWEVVEDDFVLGQIFSWILSVDIIRNSPVGYSAQ